MRDSARFLLIDNDWVELDTSLRCTAVTGDSWPSLFFLWFCWLLAATLAPGQIVGPVEVAGLAGIVWLGHVAAAVLSGRNRWILHGSIAVVVSLLIAVLIHLLTQTPYPTSSIEWVPFAAGSAFRWQFFGVVVAIAASAAIALHAPTRYSQLARAGLVAPLALAYFFLPEHWLWWYHPSGSSQLLILTVTLAALGMADTTITKARARRKAAMVAVFAAPFATLAILVLAAGILWWIALAGTTPFPTYDPIPEPDNNAPALGTVAGILLTWIIVCIYLIRRILQSSKSADERPTLRSSD